MQVAVCVITYKRPIGLARLLDGLNALTFAGDPPCVRCIIVENDESGTAATVCDEARAGFRWELESYTEPRRGIPFARNTAVARALETADFIAFIDDDEVPEPTWLDELLRVQREYRSDVGGATERATAAVDEILRLPLPESKRQTERAGRGTPTNV